MSWLYKMYATLNAEIGSAEEFAKAASGWLTGCLAEVFPELRQGTWLGSGAEEESGGSEPSVQVTGSLFVYQNDPVVGPRELEYSDDSWHRLLTGLNDYPFSVQVRLGAVDEQGVPLYSPADIDVQRDTWSPQWASFSFTATVDTATWPGDPSRWPESPRTQERWASFVKSEAVRICACAGGMIDDVAAPETGLQRATFNTFARVPESRQVLRGYSWVTIVPPELAVRVGGVSGLKASGAFYEVDVLPGGSVWLRATPTINEFTEDRIWAVFRTLAPILVTGVARFRIPGETYRIVEGVDATDYR